MENISKANEQYFADFSKGNKEKLQQIIYALNAQTEKLKQTQDIFKTDLIPALDKQNEATRQRLIAELTQAHATHENSLKSNQQQVLTSLAKMDSDNKKLIGIVKKSIMVNEGMKSLIASVQGNIGGTNKNINQTRQAMEQNIGGINKNIDRTRQAMSVLQEVLASRLTKMAQERAAVDVRFNKELAEIKENQKAAEPQLQILIDVSKQVSEQFAQTNLHLIKSIKAMDSNTATPSSPRCSAANIRRFIFNCLADETRRLTNAVESVSRSNFPLVSVNGREKRAAKYSSLRSSPTP